MSVLEDVFFHLECIRLWHISHFVSVSKTQLFLLRRFVGLVDYKFNLLRILKLNVFMNHHKWITSCLDGLNESHSMHIQRFLVITNRDFYGLISITCLPLSWTANISHAWAYENMFKFPN